jgi:hypothetical protein
MGLFENRSLVKHDWQLDEKGEIDEFAFVFRGAHNGPKCLRCGRYACQFCVPSIYDEECPQPDLLANEAAPS